MSSERSHAGRDAGRLPSVHRSPHPTSAENPAFDVSPFLKEWLAGGRPSNQLPISSVCNCRCLFCSNDQNPFPVLGGAFREIEDIKTQLCATPGHDDPIYMSDSLPGRISEGEAFLHPRLFEILDLVRRRFFYNTLRFTTNASMLDEAFFRQLAAYRPIEITVSLHSIVPQHWATIFARTEREARKALAAVPLVRRFGMGLVGTIVPLPRICGWDDLERTYGFLVSNGATRMVLYGPGYTSRTPEARVSDLFCSMEELNAFCQRMKGRFDVPVSAFPETVGPLQLPVEIIIRKTLHGNPGARGGAYRRVIWLSSIAAFDRLEPSVAEQSVGPVSSHHVVPVENTTYGGNIIVAGLLTVEDFVLAGREALRTWPDTELFLVPAGPFDSLIRDIAGTPAHQIAERLEKPVWLVGPDGAVESLLGWRVLKRRPQLAPGLMEAMATFNRGWTDAGCTEHALESVAEYPVATSGGLLSRDQLKHLMRGAASGNKSAAPESQRFEYLDEDHVLCIETWFDRTSGESVQRWTRLVRVQSDWLVTSIEGKLAGSNLPLPD